MIIRGTERSEDSDDAARMDAKLYVIPGSHPSRTVMRMLELKGIAYKRVDLMPVISQGVLRAMRLSRGHDPGAEDRRPKDHRLARDREGARPRPARAAPVPRRSRGAGGGRAGRGLGRDDAADAARRILWNALKRDRAPLASFSEGAKLGHPDRPRGARPRRRSSLPRCGSTRPPTTGSAPTSPRCPGMLDQIDDWIAEGVLGGEQLNAADLQIGDQPAAGDDAPGPAPGDRGPPGGRAGDARGAGVPGRAPPVLPPAWLEPLRKARGRGVGRSVAGIGNLYRE